MSFIAFRTSNVQKLMSQSAKIDILSDVLSACAVMCATIVVFVIAQSMFWSLIGSKQYEVIIGEKMKVLSSFFARLNEPEIHKTVCKTIKASINTNDAIENAREEENKKLLFNNFKTFTATFAIMFVLVSIAYLIRSNFESMAISSFGISLLFVLLSFSTEIVVFHYVITPYIVAGDIELTNKLSAE